MMTNEPPPPRATSARPRLLPCALACALAACSGAPAAPAVDARVDDATQPTGQDASAPAEDRAPTPDVAPDVAPDAPPDVAAGPALGTALATAPRICGVSLLGSAGDYVVAWGEHVSARENAVRFARIVGGRVAREATVATGEGDAFCVPRQGLLSTGEGVGRAEGGFVVGWQRVLGDAVSVRGALLDANGVALAVTGPERAAVRAAPPTNENLAVTPGASADGGRAARFTYQAIEGGRAAVRTVEFDFLHPAASGGGAPTAAALRERLDAVDAPGDVRLVVGELDEAVLVAYNPAPLGGSSLTLRLLTQDGWRGGAETLPTTLTEPRPVALEPGGNGRRVLVYAGGARNLSVRAAEVDWGLAGPFAERVIADDVAWLSADATAPSDCQGNAALASHGRTGGSNDAVLLAPAGERDPFRCEVLRSGVEGANFVSVAYLRRGCRDRLVLGVSRGPAREGSRDALLMRWLADGDVACR